VKFLLSAAAPSPIRMHRVYSTQHLRRRVMLLRSHMPCSCGHQKAAASVARSASPPPDRSPGGEDAWLCNDHLISSGANVFRDVADGPLGTGVGVVTPGGCRGRSQTCLGTPDRALCARRSRRASVISSPRRAGSRPLGNPPRGARDPDLRSPIVDAHERRVVEAGEFELRVGRSSRSEDQLRATFTVE
jgi:hypothetical protein